MKFAHIADLHIGKRVHDFSMLEDQRYILNQMLGIFKDQKVEGVLIAGDVYDKTVPSAEAVQLFDEFITRLAKEKIPVYMISGNHDSSERLQYASGILKKHQIHLAGIAPRTQEEYIEKVTLTDEYGEVNFYLLPFLKPAYVRRVFDEEIPETYSEAVRCLIEREKIDFCNKRNVLISHQFYTGKDNPQTCDSETFSVGGIDNIDIGCVKEFDYVALGHLHGEQSVGMSHIRYCGTLLKYSVSESSHHKSLSVVTLKEKGTSPQIELLPLHPLRDVQKKRGQLEEILKQAEEKEKDDYISITLTDEVEPYKPKEQLEKVFSHILEVRVDNTRTRNKLQELDEELTIKDPLESFADFYQEMQGKEMGEEEQEIMMQILEEAKGEKQ